MHKSTPEARTNKNFLLLLALVASLGSAALGAGLGEMSDQTAAYDRGVAAGLQAYQDPQVGQYELEADQAIDSRNDAWIMAAGFLVNAAIAGLALLGNNIPEEKIEEK